MKLYLGKWGKHLNSRRLGQEIRFLLYDELKKGSSVEVDLKGVVTASYDFCVQAFAKLNLYVPNADLKSLIRFVNVNDEIESTIRVAFDEKKPELNPPTPRYRNTAENVHFSM
jgi:hypothetical protein